jgi:hypothetical protein
LYDVKWNQYLCFIFITTQIKTLPETFYKKNSDFCAKNRRQVTKKNQKPRFEVGFFQAVFWGFIGWVFLGFIGRGFSGFFGFYWAGFLGWVFLFANPGIRRRAPTSAARTPS